jgi:hypothetical protein
MPAGYQKERPYPGKYVKLQEAADAHQLIEVWCAPCRRLVRFLAADLIAVGFDPRRDVTKAPYKCSRCGNYEMLRVTVTTPDRLDYGFIEVRRPGPVITTQTWRTVKLGDP